MDFDKLIEYVKKDLTTITTNEDYLSKFTTSKKIEGCSEKTLNYYKSICETALNSISKPISQITTEDLRSYITKYQEGKTLKEAVSNYEHTLIQRALIENGNNVAQTAASLGITRACLYKKLEAMKLKDKD